MSELRFQQGAATTFDACFAPIEQGAGIAGQEYLTQPAAVREDTRQGLADVGGPVQLEVDITYASGRR